MEIENIRIALSKLISESDFILSDQEIIRLSELLDQLLANYHNLK